MTVILGLNAYHGDSSAAIVVDGKLIAAVEEERFRRIKHWAGFPSLSIEYCLKEAGVSLSDVSHVAINSDPSAHMGQKVAFALKKRPDLNQILKAFSVVVSVNPSKKNSRSIFRCPYKAALNELSII